MQVKEKAFLNKIRECRRGNQKRTIQRNWQHKIKNEDQPNPHPPPKKNHNTETKRMNNAESTRVTPDARDGWGVSTSYKTELALIILILQTMCVLFHNRISITWSCRFVHIIIHSINIYKTIVNNRPYVGVVKINYQTSKTCTAPSRKMKKKQYNTFTLVQVPETGNIFLSVCVSHHRT